MHNKRYLYASYVDCLLQQTVDITSSVNGPVFCARLVVLYALMFSENTCIPPGFIFSNSTFCSHSVFTCFVWVWEQTAIISLYSINRLVFITETECVYSAVRTGSLYTDPVFFSETSGLNIHVPAQPCQALISKCLPRLISLEAIIFRQLTDIRAQNSPPEPTFFHPAKYFRQSTSSILPSSLPGTLPCFFYSLPLPEGRAGTFWKPSEQ